MTIYKSNDNKIWVSSDTFTAVKDGASWEQTVPTVTDLQENYSEVDENSPEGKKILEEVLVAVENHPELKKPLV